MEDKRIESIGDTLRYFRAVLNFRQKEMLTLYSDHSAYSRIENNERDLKCIELFNILDNSSIDMIEFISYMISEDPQKQYIQDYFNAANDIENEEKKAIVIQHLDRLTNINNKDVTHLSNILSIKAFFSDCWDNVSLPTEEELRTAYEYLADRKYFLKHDYHLLNNLVHLLSSDRRKAIMRNAFPVKDIEKRDHDTLKFAFNSIPNAATLALQENNYNEAREYIGYHKQLDNKLDFIQYKMDAKYIENLLDYLETGNNKSLQKVYNYQSVLEDIGFDDHAKRIDNEIRLFTYGNVERSDVKLGLF